MALTGIAKNDPAAVARRVMDGLEQRETEIVVDDASRAAKAALSGPAEGLVRPDHVERRQDI